jgi:hypothetical protein
MKKKIYMSPETTVIEINMNQQILAGSPLLGGEYNGGTVLSPSIDDLDNFDE